MKNKIVVCLTALLCLFSITSCGENSDDISSQIANNSSSTSFEDTSSSATSSSSVTSDLVFIEDVVCEEDQQVNELGSVSGLWLDLAIGCHLQVGKPYNLNINKPASCQGDFVFTYSNPDILEITNVQGNQYSITVKKAGGTILSIYDEDGYLFYRDAINCRDKLTVEQAQNYMSTQVNYWKSCYSDDAYNNYKIVFEDTNNAILRSMEMGAMLQDVYMELTYTSELITADYDEYVFSVKYSVEDETAANDLKPTTFTITAVCDLIHLSDKVGLIDFFKPIGD